MILIFVDETSDSKFKKYFGISIAIVKHNYYKIIKDQFQSILRNSEWNEAIEFKGSFLFSASKGDPNVSIESRIEIAKKILDLNIAKKNARMSFYYAKIDTSNDHNESYLYMLPFLLDKTLKKAESGSGKDIIALFCDQRTGIKQKEIQEKVEPIIKEKGYSLLEQVTMANSNFDTVGILYADIVGYLTARIDTISNDSELFEGLTQDMIKNSGKLKKLKSSEELIDKIKNLSLYEVKIK